MSPTVLLPSGLSDQLAEVKGASTQISKRYRPQTILLVNEIVEAAESGKRLEAAHVLSGFDELMSRQTDMEEKIKALTGEVAKYHGTNVFFKCACLKVFLTFDQLENHEKDEHKKGSEEFICVPGCGKVYKVKGAFDKHQERDCPALIEKRPAALPQSAYGMPVFMPTGPRMSLPHHPPFIDTCPLYQHGGVFRGLSVFESSTMDPTSVQSSHLASASQGHLNFLPQSFVAQPPHPAPPTSGQEHDPTPFSSPSPRAPARRPSAQDQNPREEEPDLLSQPAISFWGYPPPGRQVQHLVGQFSVCPQSNPRRPSDPCPFGVQGKRSGDMDGNLENQQPPIKRRRSEQVSRMAPRTLLPAKHITSLPLQADSGPRYKTRSPRKAKSQSPARITSPNISSEGVAPSSIPLRARSQGLSDATSTHTSDERAATDDVAILNVCDDRATEDDSGTAGSQWTFHRTDVYNGAPVPISVQTSPVPQRPRYGSQVLAPVQQYHLGEHSGLSVNLAETCSGPYAGFEGPGVPASGNAYPPDFLSVMDRQHPGHEQPFGAVFPRQEGAGWGHFTVPDWSGRGGGHGEYAM